MSQSNIFWCAKNLMFRASQLIVIYLFVRQIYKKVWHEG